MSDKKTRYFIVHLIGKNNEDEAERMKLHIFIDDGGYVNERHIHITAQEEFDLKDPYITRVDELNEEDFYDFIAVEEDFEVSGQDEFL